MIAFSTTNVQVESFVNSCKSGTYDLNPNHQRNVVHNINWQSEIIVSVLKGMPLGTPEFDTCLLKNGLEYNRSLD